MADFFTILLSLVLVLITGVYAYLTFEILRAMRADSESAARPYVSFNFVTTPPLVEATLRNSGRTSAHNVTVNWNQTLLVRSRLGDRQPSMVYGSLPFLAPDQEVREFIGSFSEIVEQISPAIFEGELHYDDANGKTYSERFKIDLELNKMRLSISKKETAKELEQTRKAIEKLTSEVKGIREEISKGK